MLALARDGRCVVCGEASGLSVHHIRPRVLGGNHRPANLVTLCTTCHEGIESRAELVARLLVWLTYGPALQLARIVAPLRWRKRVSGNNNARCL